MFKDPKLTTAAVPSGDLGSGLHQLAFSALQNYGGVNGLVDMLKTSLDKAISGVDADFLERKNVYGSKTYPRKKPRSFWRFLLDAYRDITLVILMVAAVTSFALGIKLAVCLNGAAKFVGIVGLAVAVAVLVVLLARNFTGHSKDTEETSRYSPGRTKASDAIDGAIKIFTVAVTIVVAVPEGLPLAVTLTLAFSMKKMTGDKALVRSLSVCETMGSATTICSDKTGTLTINVMTVDVTYIFGGKIDPSKNRSLPPKVASLLIEGIRQHTTGSVFMSEGCEVEVSGLPTEKAILQWGVNLGMVFDAVRSGSSIIHAFPFYSEKKRGGVAVQLTDSDVHVHWKGATEVLLACCTSYINVDEGLVPMEEDKRTLLKKAFKDLAAGSLRCIAFAYRTCEEANVLDNKEELAHWNLRMTLSFLGL